MSKCPPTYWDYLQLESLLSLQGGMERDESEVGRDELMFVVVHQIDELWFKLALRELESIRDLFASPVIEEQVLSNVVRGLRRTVQIFRQLTSHFTLMETLTTRDYLAFRDKLQSASGFQSAQLRELEILMGLKMEGRLSFGKDKLFEVLKNPDGSPSFASKKVEARMQNGASLLEVIEDWLYRTPIDGSVPVATNSNESLQEDQKRVDKFIAEFCSTHRQAVEASKSRALARAQSEEERASIEKRFVAEAQFPEQFLRAQDVEEERRARTSRVRAALVFIESYRELPLLAWPREVLDSLVEMEQSMIIFRQRHARMVERIIGRRSGTGGSAGVDYLDQSAIRYRIFSDLWAVRTVLLKEDSLKSLEHAADYDFIRR